MVARLLGGWWVLWVLDMWKPRQGRVNPSICGKRESSSSCPIPQSITLVRTCPTHDSTTYRRPHPSPSAVEPPAREKETASSLRAHEPQNSQNICLWLSRCCAAAIIGLCTANPQPVDHAIHQRHPVTRPPTPAHPITAHNDTATAARTRPRWNTTTAPTALNNNNNNMSILTGWPPR